MDSIHGIVPDSMLNSGVSSTASSVAIGCLAEVDGLTEVSMERNGTVVPERAPIFDGVLETPRRRIEVCTVVTESLLEETVTGPTTRVRVWTNDLFEPDSILIVLE